MQLDPTTNRPFGDHGTAAQAIDWATHHNPDGPMDGMEFISAWTDGAAADEWPDFYEWLNKNHPVVAE